MNVLAIIFTAPIATGVLLFGAAGAAQAAPAGMSPEVTAQCERARPEFKPYVCSPDAADPVATNPGPASGTHIYFVDKPPVYIGNDPVTGDPVYLDPEQDRPGQPNSEGITYFDGRDYYEKLEGPA